MIDHLGIWHLQINQIDFYHILASFFIYSFLGWVWESCYVSAKQGKWINRGFVVGPCLTIYGFGAVSVYILLQPVRYSLILLYLGGVVVATVLEYLTSLVVETLFHTSLWDYSTKRCNFQGRICLGSSIAWGVFTLLLFLCFQPVVGILIGAVSQQAGQYAILLVTVVYMIDFTLAVISFSGISKKLVRLEELRTELRDYVRNTRLYGTKEEIRDRYLEFRRSQDPLTRRFLRAYPKLGELYQRHYGKKQTKEMKEDKDGTFDI